MQKNVFRAMGLFAVSLCGVATAAQLSPDELAKQSFDQLLLRCTDAFKAEDREKVNNPPQGGYVKVRQTDLKTNYDITRTQSLVSPFMGSLSVSRTGLMTERYPTREEAEASTNLIPKILIVNRFTFAFQSGVWVLKDHAAQSALYKDGVPERLSAPVTYTPSKKGEAPVSPEFVCAFG